MFQEKKLALTQEWDKVFPRNEKVNHKKVTFHNHFGITLAADMYWPKEEKEKYPALAVCGAFGAVKEQHSGLYAQEMASRGYLTIAFDPSFTGESGGFPRHMSSPDFMQEDFQAAVDFLSVQDNVDPERIGIIGICGWAGMALHTASADTRIKATVAVTMYDLSRVTAMGYNDAQDSAEVRDQMRKMVSEARTLDYKSGEYHRIGGVATELPEDAPEFLLSYRDYYKTERGYHVRGVNSNDGWVGSSNSSMINTRLLTYVSEIKNAVLLVHGEKAHSRYMSEDVYKQLKGDNKELYIVPDAVHCDLYDGGRNHDKIPFDKIEEFIKKYI